MKRHAYLIVAHNQFELLQNLVMALDSPAHDIYLHIDAKVKDFDFEKIQSCLKYSKLYYTKRLKISWGGFSMIRAELLLLETAVNNGDYSYYHLLSGVDIPLKTNAELDRFFEKHEGAEFVHFCGEDFSKSDQTQWRARYYHLLRDVIGREGHGLLWMLEYGSLKLQKLLGITRNKDIEMFCGANWFSITQACAKYVLEHTNWVVKHFAKTCCADELWLQSLIKASPFWDKVYDTSMSGDYHGCMRLVDFARGNPYIFCMSDYQQLKDSDFLFARKFDMNRDPDICRRLYQDLENQQIAQ